MDNDLYKQFEEKMKKSIIALNENLTGIRAGRANPAILHKVTVDYYGVQTPINQVANISVPEARVILIQPWDTTLIKEIEKSLQKSDIGINPSNDGKVIRLVFPPLTEERRKELVKTVKKDGEDAKIAVRAIRRDANDHFKKEKRTSDITEDDLKDMEKDIQKITDKYIAKVDAIVKDKEKEILEV